MKGVAAIKAQVSGVQAGIAVEWVSVAWMALEAGVGIWAGWSAHSLALAAFGADSVIELVAGAVLLWRLYVEMGGAAAERVERAERAASWVVGAALLLLAAVIAAAALHELWTRQGAETSAAGIALAIASGVLMPLLSRAKMRIGGQICSSALKADGACSIVCAYMAWTVLAGVALTAVFGWWWADAAASLVLVYFVAKEGAEAIREARGEESACGCGRVE